MKNKNEENEAAEAILLLSKDIGHEKRLCEVLGFLKAISWEKEIRHSVFEMQDNGHKIVFNYNFQEKVWSCNVLTGIVKMFDRLLTQGTNKIVINSGTIINLGNLEFIFYYCRPKRPQKSYHKLICDAIESTTEKRMTLSQIYDYFITNAGFDLVHANTWKNSIRHNLSLNKMFTKIPRDKNELKGKGSYWEIDYNLRDNYKFDSSNPTEIYDGNVKQDMNKENLIYIDNHKNFFLSEKHSDANNKLSQHEDKCKEETPDIYSLYQKPSKINPQILSSSVSNPFKRKNRDKWSPNKKRKYNFLQIENTELRKCDVENKVYDYVKQLYNTDKVSYFKPLNKTKDRRSQSIAELSKEFDSLSLFNAKQKDKNRKNLH